MSWSSSESKGKGSSLEAEMLLFLDAELDYF
jgi:hypothetical protein